MNLQMLPMATIQFGGLPFGGPLAQQQQTGGEQQAGGPGGVGGLVRVPIQLGGPNGAYSPLKTPNGALEKARENLATVQGLGIGIPGLKNNGQSTKKLAPSRGFPNNGNNNRGPGLGPQKNLDFQQSARTV